MALTAGDLVYGGNVSAPTAGTAIAQSATLPPGVYDCWVYAQHDSGTPAAAEINNIELQLATATTTFGPLPMVITTDTVTPSGPFRIYVPEGGDKIGVVAVGNATTAVKYYATLQVRVVATFP